jgi:uncharacterized protein (TIGR00299 family) protein
MFVAALLNAWPALADELPALLTAAGLPPTVTVQALPCSDHGLQGTRFQVTCAGAAQQQVHTPFRAIREQLWNSALPAGVKERAVAIFTLLAAAEAQVHDIEVDAVALHEVGAWDSIADIVAAAFLLESLPITSWSVAALPLGSGRVRTAHGWLPVPAPATVRLLQGFVVQDDGREGERITPTGAAILHHLAPTYGIGFGTRHLDGLPNILRLLVLEPLPVRQTEDVAVLQFEVDDQPAEDLALGLAKLRNLPAVLDVIQLPAVGKQGRLITQIQILARPEALDSVIEQCFSETTTLGLRWQISRRSVLERQTVEYNDGGQRIRVKVARRPHGVLTGKAEFRDVAPAGGYAERAQLRQRAEHSILNRQAHDAE